MKKQKLDNSKFTGGGSSSNNSSPDIPQLITERQYDVNEFEDPTLHVLITNGKFEEAKRIIGRFIVGEAISHKCILKRKVEVQNSEVQNSVDNYRPRQVESFCPAGNLPIHSLFQRNDISAYSSLSDDQRMELLKLLLDELPEGPRVKVINSRSGLALPLSLACEPSVNVFREEECLNCDPGIYSLSIDSTADKMIRLLIDKYPTATIVLFDRKKSALQIMLEHRPNLELTKFVLETSKTARHSVVDHDKVIHGSVLKHRNDDEELPIHTAIKYHAPCDVIQYLIKEFPGGLNEMIDNGDLPLHCAARYGCTAVVLDSLLNGFPAAVAAKNNDGKTPLHLLLDDQELWSRNFFVPKIKCEAATKERIISYYKESTCHQVKPNSVVLASTFLKKMIWGYYKHLLFTKENDAEAVTMIKTFLQEATVPHGEGKDLIQQMMTTFENLYDTLCE